MACRTSASSVSECAAAERRASDWNAGLNTRALSRFRCHRDVAADLTRAFSHAYQSQPVQPIRERRIEAEPVVNDMQNDLVGAGFQPHDRGRCLAVPDGVAERFLSDSVHAQDDVLTE